MNRSVGPLLWLGLGLCAASGCALSAPSRASGLAAQTLMRGEKATRGVTAARSKSSNDDVEVRETRSLRESVSRGVVSFRSPFRGESSLHESPLDDHGSQSGPVIAASPSRREIMVSAKTHEEATGRKADSSERDLEPSGLTPRPRDDANATPSFVGHSSDQPSGVIGSDVPVGSHTSLSESALQTGTRPVTGEPGGVSPRTLQTRAKIRELTPPGAPRFHGLVEHDGAALNAEIAAGEQRSIEQPRGKQAVARTEEQRPDQIVGSGIRTANYRSDQDAADNPVELQGFEVIAPLASVIATANPNDPPPWGSRPGAGTSVQVSPPIESGGALPSRHARNTPGGFHSLPPGEVFLAPQGDARDPASRVQPINAQATPPLPPSPWQPELEQLIARIERELKGLPPGSTIDAQAEYRRRQVHLRLLHLIAHRPEQALTAIPGLEAAEQEYWQQLCWAASNSLDAEQFPLPRDRASQAIAPLNTALRRLREQADLSIKNTAFCEQISYFGNYQKFARDEFTPGQEVLLYAEIENFNTEQTAGGEHRTLLRSVIDILGPNGETRWHKTFPATEDRCRNPRRDYFHNYQFAIPDRLPLGPHTLKLTVVDDLSGKQASSSLRLLVK